MKCLDYPNQPCLIENCGYAGSIGRCKKMEGDVVTKAQPMKNYVVIGIVRFEFKAVSWGDAKRIGKFKLKEVGVPLEDVGIVCEETGEEETLQ